MREELYKRHRPQRLSRVVGNSDTVATLENMLKRGTLPHVLLFHGPSGCGKTTLARILRTRLDCHDMDFREVNSSSFRGIDSVRDIARMMNLAPVGPCRIYIIDECHKMTNDAQNAALKMLEDTPSHVYFFLCTTDPQKLIKPIRTRCCEMPVRLLTYTELEGLATRVAKREKIDIPENVMDELVSSAQGAARTLLVLLDKIANLEPGEMEEAIQSKLSEESEAIELCRALIKRRSWNVVAKILKNLKGDPEAVRWAVLGYARSVLLGSGEGLGQAYVVIDCFKEPFYESKGAGLVAACFEAIQEP